jgi:DnaJ-class molecular chaperone
VRCEKCRGRGTIYAGPRFTTHGGIVDIHGRQTNCPECLGVGTILAPVLSKL